ncbi:aldehyde dehydrogenase family protein [Streptomyces sp. MP131-18]|uniref:aldehyde dehydrogenase family protein n=1 Tax=Streptomyces sp. MP131-18 TaxID=1857892 RepID=UPI00097BF414|nr:aldehyde dehydrogenase family protein [Streptomyces sp. MP131-18]ONK13155.1 Geranial dehydrogenase [Streptomyces sp. MP131-18]
MTNPFARWLHRDSLYINGRWQLPFERGTHTLINPVTERPLAEPPEATAVDIDLAVSAARTAFDAGPWPRLTPDERAAALAPLAEQYAKHERAMAELITIEMGSPAGFTSQTSHPRQIIDYYTTRPQERFSFSEPRDGYTLHREPVGVVGIITPWNMPQKTIVMKLVPALIAGCTVVVKPAPATPLDALALAELLDACDLPPGVVNVVPAASAQTSQQLAAHPCVDKIAFTGSTRTGSLIASLCGKAMRRCSLELGGKSPMLLLDDADIAAAAATVPAQSLANSGQICSNLTRVLVPARRHGELLDALDKVFDELTIGDPTDRTIDIGPLVSSQQRNAAVRQIANAERAGARVHRGGNRLDREGYFLTPAIVTDVTPANPLFSSEVFAPVLAVTTYDTEDDAVLLANATRYGLDAAVHSAEPEQAHRVARRIRAGTVRINGAETGIDAPLGGFKESGIGRELGPEGLYGFTEPKVIA